MKHHRGCKDTVEVAQKPPPTEGPLRGKSDGMGSFRDHFMALDMGDVYFIPEGREGECLRNLYIFSVINPWFHCEITYTSGCYGIMRTEWCPSITTEEKESPMPDERIDSVPIPKGAVEYGSKSQLSGIPNLLRSLEPNTDDCILFSSEELRALSGALAYLKKHDRMHFAVAREEDGKRVWRLSNLPLKEAETTPLFFPPTGP